MTINRMTLKARFEKGPDNDFLRGMIGFVATRMMDGEVEELAGASAGERSVSPTNRTSDVRL